MKLIILILFAFSLNAQQVFKQESITAIKFECNYDEIHDFCPDIIQTYYLNDIYFIYNDISMVKGDWLVKTKEGKYFICDGEKFKENDIINSVKTR